MTLTGPHAVLLDLLDAFRDAAAGGRAVPAERVPAIRDALADLHEMTLALEAAYLGTLLAAGERPVLPSAPTLRRRVAAALQRRVQAGRPTRLGPLPRPERTLSGCYTVVARRSQVTSRHLAGCSVVDGDAR